MTDLKEYYRRAVAARVTELEAALTQLASDRDIAMSTIRRAAHSLRGSGGTYGFHEVSAAAGIVEDAQDEALGTATSDLLAVLRSITAAAAPRPRVLVVDDDPEIVLLLRTVLSSPDRELCVAQSAAAAHDAVEAGSFDVVLLDLLLPDADGRTVLRGMRQRESLSGAFIIVLSGKSAGTTADECLALGADAYIEKPFDPVAVADRVSRHLEQRA